MAFFFILRRVTKSVGKGENAYFSPLPAIPFKCFFLRVVTWDCVVKGLLKIHIMLLGVRTGLESYQN